MTKQKYLGEFEQTVMLALLKSGNRAYGAMIRSVLLQTIQRDVAIGALYSTMDRLEKKGLVVSELGEPTAARGGRAKRYFQVTAKGEQALIRSLDAMQKMWDGVNLKQQINV